jgi:two-component system, NtrC family, sensor kinase
VNDGPHTPPIPETPAPPPAAAAPPPPVGDESAQARFVARLLDQTSQPFVALDFDARITRCNRAFEALLGYSADELRGRTVQDITPPGSVPTSMEALGRLHATGQPQRYEKEYRSKDGRIVSVAVVTDFVRDEQDRPTGYYAFITDIGELKRAEEVLRASEERFRRLYDEAPIGYHEIDTEGTILSVNRTECELLGYSREEMVGRPIFDFIRADERDEARRAVAERMSVRQSVMAAERVYVTKGGRELNVWVENRLIRDAQGRVVGMRTTVQDITARRQAEAALVASERRVRALFEGIEDAVFVHDMEGRILDANPAACRRLGYSREELLRLTTRDIDDPEFAAGFEGRLCQQLQSGHLSCEGRHRTKDGRVIPVDINTSTIQLEDQRVVLAVIRDITERKALEETRRRFAEAQAEAARALEAKNRELTKSEARYRQLTEGSLDAIVVADQEGLITLFNPAAERTFGYLAEEVVGRSLTMLIPDELRPRHEAGFRRYVRTRDPRVVGRTVEMRGRRKDGAEFPLELSLNAVDIGGQVQFIGSIRDQTERQRMRAMLMQTEKLASIGLLSAGVAHEINNPLAYIANNLAVLERDLAGVRELVAAYESARDAMAAAAPEALRRVDQIADELDWPYVRDNLGRMIGRTRDGVQRVANIVQNLRGLARTSPPKLEPAPLSDLIPAALEMVQGRLRRGHIEVEVRAADLPRLDCVPTQISQVLLNLLINAIQAVEEAGRPEGGHVRIATRAEGGYQVVEVEDDGVGIAPEQIPNLFDPFYTTKPVGEGTGLGLAISHGIVTGHGGRIEVESRPGRGTCFRVFLPERAGPRPAAGPPPDGWAAVAQGPRSPAASSAPEP